MTSDPIQGEAVFGTIKGLTVVGNGALTLLPNSLALVEFQSLVEKAPKSVKIGFRRSLLFQDGKRIDLLGTLAAAKDRVGRDGFVGGAVAVSHLDFSAYHVAFARSLKLLEGILEDSWEWGVNAIEKRASSGSWGELKNKYIREADEDSDVIILRKSPAIDIDTAALFSLGASQVGAVRQYADSLVVINDSSEMAGDSIDSSLLEYCIIEKEKDFQSVNREKAKAAQAMNQLRSEHQDLQKQYAEVKAQYETLAAAQPGRRTRNLDLNHTAADIGWSGPRNRPTDYLGGGFGHQAAAHHRRNHQSLRARAGSYDEELEETWFDRFSRYFSRPRKNRRRGRQRSKLRRILKSRYTKVVLVVLILVIASFIGFKLFGLILSSISSFSFR